VDKTLFYLLLVTIAIMTFVENIGFLPPIIVLALHIGGLENLLQKGRPNFTSLDQAVRKNCIDTGRKLFCFCLLYLSY
jgi:hypothetical protein